MAKLQSSFKNMLIALFAVCFTVAALLALVYQLTAKPIAEANAMKLQNAIGEVVPKFDNDPVAEAFMMPIGEADSLLVYPAKKEGKIVGYAVNSLTRNGFSGDISILVGFDMEHHIVNYSVLQHAETPGLGSKMGEWFKDEAKPSQSVIGRDLSKGELSVRKDGGSIDAITASTITSRAFLEALNKAYTVYTESIKSASEEKKSVTAVAGDTTITQNIEGTKSLEKGGNDNE